MKIVGLVLILALLISCEYDNSSRKNISNRKEILGRDFSNSEVISIEVVEIEHPLLGEVIEVKKLTDKQKEKFLTDFDAVKERGLFKCASKYVIRLNFDTDTLRLKVCGTKLASRENDVYYELENKRNIIEEFVDTK